MRRFQFFLFVCIAVVVLYACRDASQPFYSEIKAFKKADAQQLPPKDAILFIGSSSIRMWDSLPSYFPGYTIVQRGFGGSGLNDAIRYADDIIFPYHPKQLVIFSGENDIAAGAKSTEVLQRFMELFKLIRSQLPSAGVVYISIKPSPSRAQFMPVMEEANAMIRQFLSGYSETAYVDVYHRMLDSDGKPRAELFLDDQLHMNRMGYEIWKEDIAPLLEK